MARSSKPNWLGFGIIAGAIALGVKFHEEIMEQVEKFTAKKA